ncbi:hypothetical protein AABC73_01740 [Pseudomonas sp. G.S.17]|uniref:hypothetical protein n=1 Tax=Pseudomonas sp. G.S.17 TaxID=3137451 RepID=UPI00311C8BA4
MSKEYEILLSRIASYEAAEARYWKALQGVTTSLPISYTEFLGTDGAGWWDDQGGFQEYVQIGEGTGSSFYKRHAKDLPQSDRQLLLVIRVVLENPEISRESKEAFFRVAIKKGKTDYVFTIIDTGKQVSVSAEDAMARKFGPLFQELGVNLFLQYDPEYFD